ncbi:F-box protein At3g07870-like [Papaver somniferum]|uniref:F-box protein At3g07870-like n=1 Tax=Papaver somniferum TaxID=3469 RepID=UPI000E6FC6FC|nr:F-box protein At3g07870-like [Papaver somniferum]
MENLHSDTLENILSRIPIEEALHAKRVSKTWRAILRYRTSEKAGFFFAFSRGRIGIDEVIREELFYEDEYDHYDHTKMNYYYTRKTLSKIEHGSFATKAPTRDIMVGSCNGLVCFCKFNGDARVAEAAEPFLVCNPLTGESAVLPKYNYELHWDTANQKIPCGGRRLTSGFGYCPSTNKYKVVTIYYSDANKNHAYTVGGEWRYIGYIDRHIYTFLSGIYPNGTLYWLQKILDMVQESEVVAFDMQDEKFDYIALPSSGDLEYETSFVAWRE